MSLRNQEVIINFVSAAMRYSELIESKVNDKDKWLEEVLAALSSLYSLAHKIPDVEYENERYGDQFDVTDDEWKAIFNKLGVVFGEQRYYRAFFDPTEPMQSRDGSVIGDLADDLADIYRDIVPGLRAWNTKDEAFTNEAIFSWKDPLFTSHWGVHAVSAMRALHPLVYLRGLKD
jgi:hypothetical protein